MDIHICDGNFKWISAKKRKRRPSVRINNATAEVHMSILPKTNYSARIKLLNYAISGQRGIGAKNAIISKIHLCTSCLSHV